MYKIEEGDKALNYVVSKVSAGFPSPADDYLENELSLDKLLIKNRLATFLIRVGGDSMTGLGIYENNILIVDRSLEPKNKDVVVAAISGDLTVKKIIFNGKNGPELHSANPLYPNIRIKDKEDFVVWGVVTANIHQLIK